ncbi:MAG: cyclase family protein [Candidatus Aenigmatarchaeota archaeon]
MRKVRIYDLSHMLVDEDPADPEGFRPKIVYKTHQEGAMQMRKFFGVNPADLVYSEGLGWALEELHMITHSGTHVDAPWHYSPVSEGRRARTIDEMPLEFFYGDGVLLDFRHKLAGETITAGEIKEALQKIDYKLKPFDIVLIMTGWDKKIGTPEYFDNPGLNFEAVNWIVEQGVKLIGIDAYSLDRSFAKMKKDYNDSKDGRKIWEAHFAGIQKEYLHIEKLANLDKLPKPYGFKVLAFPIKIYKASAAPARVVAILEE